MTAIDVHELAAEIAPLLSPAIPPLLDAKGAAELLNVPDTWISAQARAGRIPHVKLGHYVRFDRDDLLAWLDQRSAGPRERRTAR